MGSFKALLIFVATFAFVSNAEAGWFFRRRGNPVPSRNNQLVQPNAGTQRMVRMPACPAGTYLCPRCHACHPQAGAPAAAVPNQQPSNAVSPMKAGMPMPQVAAAPRHNSDQGQSAPLVNPYRSPSAAPQEPAGQPVQPRGTATVKSDLEKRFEAINKTLVRPSTNKPTNEFYGSWVGRCISRQVSISPKGNPEFTLSDTQTDYLRQEINVGTPAVQGENVDVLPVGKALRFGLLVEPKYNAARGQFFTENREASSNPVEFSRDFLRGFRNGIGGGQVMVNYTTYRNTRMGFYKSGENPRLVFSSNSLQTYDSVAGAPFEQFPMRESNYVCVYMPEKEAEARAKEGKVLSLEDLTKIDP